MNPPHFPSFGHGHSPSLQSLLLVTGVLILVAVGGYWATTDLQISRDIVLAVTVLVPMAAFIYVRPYWGLVIVIASIPVTSGLPILPWLSSFTQFAAGLTLAFHLVRILGRGHPIRFDGGLKYVLGLLFLSGVLASMLFGITDNRDRLWPVTYAQLLVLIWLSSELLTSMRKIRTLMAIFIISVVVSIIVGIAQELPESLETSVASVEGLAGNENELALYSIWAAMFSLYFLFTPNSSGRTVMFLLTLLISVVGVAISGSRGGFLVLPITAIFFVSFMQTWKLRIRVLPVIIVTTIGTVILLSQIAQWSHFSATPSDVKSGLDTVGIRYELWDSAFTVWWQHPLLGIGPGGFPDISNEVTNLPDRFSAIAVHNMYMTVLSELGLVGFLLFIAIIAVTWLELRNARRNGLKSAIMLISTWQAVFLATLLLGIKGDLHYSKLLWLIFGMGFVLRRQWMGPNENTNASNTERPGRKDFATTRPV